MNTATIVELPSLCEIFGLTLYPGKIVDPLEMVKKDTYPDHKRWAYRAPDQPDEFSEPSDTPLTRYFRLVRVEPCNSLEDVRQQLGEMNIPNGRWREVFKIVYPVSDSGGPIGIADPSWIRPEDKRGSERDDHKTEATPLRVSFPALHEGFEKWLSHFGLADVPYDERWRWLVFSDTPPPTV